MEQCLIYGWLHKRCQPICATVAMSTLEVCVLCGHILFPWAGRRYKKHDAMNDLISRKCTPTSFVYACVTQYKGNTGKHTVCIACVNWTRSVLATALWISTAMICHSIDTWRFFVHRRLSLKKGSTQFFIPMDNLLLFVINPGKYPEPDKRTLVRLLRSLCNEYTLDNASQHCTSPMSNHYTCFESDVMQAIKRVLTEKYFAVKCVDDDSVDGITDYHKDAIVDIIIREWWVCNGMPKVLQDKTTGRYVRRMLKAHKMRYLMGVDTWGEC